MYDDPSLPVVLDSQSTATQQLPGLMRHKMDMVAAHGFQTFAFDGRPNVHIALLLVVPPLHVGSMNASA